MGGIFKAIAFMAIGSALTLGWLTYLNVVPLHECFEEHGRQCEWVKYPAPSTGDN